MFAKGLALAPWGIAASSRLLGQQSAATTETGKVDPLKAEKKKPGPESSKRPPIHEMEPFAEPLVFARHEVQPRVRPFSLNQVQLDSGPLQQARDWNRAYMMRLDNDRLLHNFRVTAGLPSEAEPLGGWEAPTSTPAAKWTMRLRIPAWTSDDSSVMINGRPIEGAASPGSYLSIRRVWKPGESGTADDTNAAYLREYS